MLGALLHLSDIQFGRQNRYGSDDASSILFSKLREDLNLLKSRHDFKITCVVVTGDIADSGSPNEYAQAQQFFAAIKEYLNIEKEKFVFVPGNHDINRVLCESARLRAKALSYSFVPPYFEKFIPYKGFYDYFYDEFREFNEKLFVLHELDEPGLIIIGLNSCFMESELPNDHYGWVSVEQVNAAIKAANQIDPNFNKLRIVLLHHNYLRRSDLDNENLRDADYIRAALEKGNVSIILHGHRHIAGVEQIRNPVTGHLLSIIGAGSAGLDGSALPEHPNQYSVLIFKKFHTLELIMRQFSTQTIGLSGLGKWISDTSISDSGLISIQLKTPVTKSHSEPTVAKELTTLVGRGPQLKQMEELYKIISNGGGALLLVEGELGIGKTTLVSTFCAQCADMATFVWGRNLPRSIKRKNQPFLYGVKQIIKRLIGFSTFEINSKHEILQDIKDGFGLNDSYSEIIATWLSSEDLFDSSESNNTRLRARLFSSLTSLLRSASLRKPLLLLLDDLQWADSDSLDFVQELAETMLEEPAPLLFICNFRPDGRAYNPGLRKLLAAIMRYTHGTVSYQLIPPMALSDIDTLIKTIDSSVSGEKVKQIYNVSKGNPFVSLELARYTLMLEAEDIKQAKIKNHFELPPSLKAIYENRLLDMQTLDVGYSLALVLIFLWIFDGETTFQELSLVLPQKEKVNPNSLIAQLVDIGLISRNADEICLSSKLLLEIIPTTLPKTFNIDMQRIYDCVANNVSPYSISARQPEFYAYVYEKSGKFRNAALAYEIAAKDSLLSEKGDLALDFINKGLNAIARAKSKESDRCEVEGNLNLLKAKIFDQMGNYTNALLAIEDILSNHENTPSTSVVVKAKFVRGILYTRTGQWSQALNVFEELLSKQDNLDEEEFLTTTLFYATSMYAACINIPKALEILETTVLQPKYQRYHQSFGRALAHLGIFNTETGNHIKAQHYFRVAERHFKIAGANIDKGLLEISHGNLAFDKEEYQKARKHQEKAQNELAKCRYKFGQATALLNHGLINYVNGEIEAGIGKCKLAEEMFIELGLDHGAGQCNIGLGWGFALIGKSTESKKFADEAKALFEITDTVDKRDFGILSCIWGFVAALEEDYDGAEAHFTDSLDCFRTASDPYRFIQAVINTIFIKKKLGKSYEKFAKKILGEDWIASYWIKKIKYLLSEKGKNPCLVPVIRLKPNA